MSNIGFMELIDVFRIMQSDVCETVESYVQVGESISEK